MSHNPQDQHSHQHHVTPLSVYYSVWITLLVFTVITVAISYVDFGSMNLVIAMIVATIKAGLVMAFFMGLKYDSRENSVAFLSSLVFLSIFITLTVTDIFYRPDVDAAPVDASGAAVATGPVDAHKLVKGGPELKTKGQGLFAQNCVTCHGAAGQGDGPAAAALNPKPRNFTAGDGWKNGRKVTQIFKTLTNGLPGTPMPAFAGISVEDRFALAHYVQSLGPQADADSEGDIEALGLNAKTQAKPELKVEDAVARYVGNTPADGEEVAYHYAPGVVPRRQYCRGPAHLRPRWCQVNTHAPDQDAAAH